MSRVDQIAVALLGLGSQAYVLLLRTAAVLGHVRAKAWVGMREQIEIEIEIEIEGEAPLRGGGMRDEDGVGGGVEGRGMRDEGGFGVDGGGMRDEGGVEVGDGVEGEEGGGRVVWVHCASLGEYEQGRPVIEAWRARHPEDAVLLTFFSPSGYGPLAARRPPWFRAGDRIAALPADVPRDVERFLDTWEGRLRWAVFVKYEVWPNLLCALHRRGIRTALVAAHVVPGAWVLRPWGRGVRALWRTFSLVLVQTQNSTDLLAAVGIRSHPAGDPRADRVLAIVAGTESAPSPPHDALTALRSGRLCVVAGSTWPAEEDALLASGLWGAEALLVLVPHDLAPAHLDALRGRLAGHRAAWWSDGPASWAEADVVVVDAVGHLAGLYRHADVAVVGGGYGAGVHNLLEPAAHGRPLVTGPRIGRFREAQLLHSAGALTLAPTPAALAPALARLLALSAADRAALGAAARALVASEAGAADRIVAALEDLR